MTALKLLGSASGPAEAEFTGCDTTEANRGDVEALAGLLARAMDQNGFLRFPEAQAENVASAADEAALLPPASLDWRHLAAVEAEQGEAAALSAWEDVKRAAREEIASGHRAAMVMEGGQGTPLDRARFLVLRESLAAEWRPASGIEWQLIDQLTQAATAQAYWTEKLACRTQQEAAEDRRDRQALSQQEQMSRWGEWLPERVTTGEAIQEAAGMADRWGRAFLRVLRQLRDLRRYSPVVINNPGQVNVAGQQVNMNKQETGLQNCPVSRERTRAKKGHR